MGEEDEDKETSCMCDLDTDYGRDPQLARVGPRVYTASYSPIESSSSNLHAFDSTRSNQFRHLPDPRPYNSRQQPQLSSSPHRRRTVPHIPHSPYAHIRFKTISNNSILSPKNHIS
jgi:hypothetical protein